MQKVLKLLGAIFMIIGLVFVALGTGLVLAAREPVLFVFAAMGMVFFFVGIGMMAALSRGRRLRRFGWRKTAAPFRRTSSGCSTTPGCGSTAGAPWCCNARRRNACRRQGLCL